MGDDPYIRRIRELEEAGNELADAAREVGAYPEPAELLRVIAALEAWDALKHEESS